ncbi:bifunctional pyr operon transcriptional regulator/uracil phosphoribosyltransferase PyrR [Candidatus Reidiella endopervernicosa]|nr:bifunctional pyr operon transcriptional regulator/uracil phosphoribosyltransferase PyrR [Candidatus Reidiella endopervernicosa]
MTNTDTGLLLENMVRDLRTHISECTISDPIMIGIHTGGVWVAERLHQLLNLESPLGSLDISFYRDDFTRIGMHPQVKPSSLPLSIEERHIILVDDVLYTGRTIRAAMNELFDYGRPASITLAVLVDRPGRELPIAADVSGVHMNLASSEQIKLSGPAPLSLTVQESS